MRATSRFISSHMNENQRANPIQLSAFRPPPDDASNRDRSWLRNEESLTLKSDRAFSRTGLSAR